MTIRKTIRSTIRRPYFDLVIPASGLNLSSNEPEVTAYIAGLTTPLSAGQITKLNTLVSSLKTGMSITNLSDVFDVFIVYANETAEAGLRNIAKDAHHATAVNSPLFTQFEGFTGNGTSSYINTNYNAAVDGVRFTLNDASIGHYNRTELTVSANYQIGAKTSSNVGVYIYLRQSESSTRVGINQSYFTNASQLSSIGLKILSRSSDSVLNYYNNKVGSNLSYASSAVPNLNFYDLAANQGGSPLFYNPSQFSLRFIGKNITESNVAVIVDSFEAYMDSNGKGVIA